MHSCDQIRGLAIQYRSIAIELFFPHFPLLQISPLLGIPIPKLQAANYKQLRGKPRKVTNVKQTVSSHLYPLRPPQRQRHRFTHQKATLHHLRPCATPVQRAKYGKKGKSVQLSCPGDRKLNLLPAAREPLFKIKGRIRLKCFLSSGQRRIATTRLLHMFLFDFSGI